MGIWPSIGYGALGAFIVYLAIFRHERLKIFVENPGEEWRVIVFDFVIYLLLGGLVTAFFVSPASTKEAIFAGGTWEGIIGGLMPTRERE